MSAEVISLDDRREPPDEPGNGAREAVLSVLHHIDFDFAMNDLRFSKPDLEAQDEFLARLWEAGFKVVPVNE